jgi:hypothetical protein
MAASIRRVALVTVLAALVASVAGAQTGAPAGFKFCGYDAGGSFTDEPQQGYATAVYGRHMTCRAVRRNYRNTDWMTTGKPKHAGWRCRRTLNQYEYAEYRCTRSGNRKRAYEWHTGS